MTGSPDTDADSATPSRGRILRAVAGHVCLILLLLAVTAVVMSPTLSAAFVYDDWTTILGNRLIDHLSLDGLAKMFGGFHLHDYYPVFYLSLAVDRSIWEMQPTGFHLTNILLHGVNVLLVYALVFRIAGRAEAGQDYRPPSGRWLIAATAGLLFAVHPNHVEPVAWLTGRKVLLAGAFGLLAVHAYLGALTDDRRRGSLLAVSVLSTALACMSNVYAIVVPALIVLIDHAFARRGWLRAAWINWPFWLIGFGAVALKVLSRMEGVAKASQFGNRTEWLLTTVSLYWDNVRSMFAPAGRNALYLNEVIDSPADAAFQFGLAAAVITAALILLLRRRRLWSVGLLWFVLALAPTSQLARHHIFRADRYLYLPGIGACLLAGLVMAGMWGGSRRLIWRLPLAIASLVVLLTFAHASRVRARDWRNDETLWQSSLALEERNADAHQSLACALMRRGALAEALQHLERCVELNPGHPDAHNTLCALLMRMGRLDPAVRHGRLTVEVRPDHAEGRFTLARALMQRRDHAEALIQWREGLARKPTDVGARFYHAETLAALGRLDDAVGEYERALAINDDYVEARYGLALALIRQGRFDDARRMLSLTVAHHPEFAEAHAQLARLAVRRDDYVEAIARYRRAIETRPDLPGPRVDLARLLTTCPRAELRDGAQAVALLEPLLEGAHRDNPAVWDALAAAHAEAGRLDQAVRAARKAVALADQAGQHDLARTIADRLARYAASRPTTEQTGPAATRPTRPRNASRRGEP